MDLQLRLSNQKLRREGAYHRYKAVETYELSSSTRTSFVSRPDDALTIDFGAYLADIL